MNFLFLWLDALLICVLWAAAVAATIGRRERTRARVLCALAEALPPLGAIGALLVWMAVRISRYTAQPAVFTYCLALFIAVFIGTVLIAVIQLRRPPRMPGAPARAPTLWLAWLMAVVMGWVIFSSMDLAIRVRCATKASEFRSLYLANLPAIPDGVPNAAPMYKTAFDRLQADDAEERQIDNPPFGTRTAFDPDEPATLAFLKHEAGTLALLRRAAAMGACRFENDLDDSAHFSAGSDANEFRNAGLVLELDARQHVAKGDAAAALADAAAVFGMSRDYGQRPFIIWALVADAIDAMGDSMLEQSLPAVKSWQDLSALPPRFNPSFRRMFQGAFKADEAYKLDVYGGVGANSETTPSIFPGVERNYLSGGGGSIQGMFYRVFIFDPEDYMRLMDHVQVLLDEPYDPSGVKTSRLASGVHDPLTSIFIPEIPRQLQVCAIIEANDACAQTAVAMTHYRIDHGTLPSRLADLVPGYMEAIPTDPFGGGPLRLKIKRHTWIIYSVGRYGFGHGGAESVTSEGNIGFSLK